MTILCVTLTTKKLLMNLHFSKLIFQFKSRNKKKYIKKKNQNKQYRVKTQKHTKENLKYILKKT